MSRYRRIDVRVWGDEKFRLFSDDGKLAFLFLLTHPGMTALGGMRATTLGLAAELGWKPRRFERAIAPAVELGMVEMNAAASYVGLPNFLKYNQPESPNVARAWVSALELIPECPEKQALIERARASLAGAFRQGFEEAFAKAFAKAFGEGCRHPLPNPEPEPEPEPEQKPEQESSLLPPFKPSRGESGNGHGERRPSRRHVNAAWRRQTPGDARGTDAP